MFLEKHFKFFLILLVIPTLCQRDSFGGGIIPYNSKFFMTYGYTHYLNKMHCIVPNLAYIVRPAYPVADKIQQSKAKSWGRALI